MPPLTASNEQFINNCHKIYDDIHGITIVTEFFDNITREQLSDLIKIYHCANPLLRWSEIGQYIEKTENLKRKGATAFYLNALQHYLELCK